MSKKIISLQPPCTISEEELIAFKSIWGSFYGTYDPNDINEEMRTHLETDYKPEKCS